MRQVALNGRELWIDVVETDEGLGGRFGMDDGQRLNLMEGQRVPVRMPGEDDVWLFVTTVTELPLVVRATMGRWVRAAE